MPSLWPFFPQAEAVEGLSWATDVIEFEDGEQRIATRPIPRADFAHTYHLTPAQYGRARELARSIGGDTCYLPIWTERTHIGAVSAHQVNLAVDPVGKQYSEAGYLLVWDADDDCEVVAIGSFGVGVINLDPWVVAAYQNAWVAPLVEASFAQELEAPRDAVDTFVRASARFDVPVVVDVSGETLSETVYKTYPIVKDPPDVGSSDQFWREVSVLDTGTGLMSKTPVRDTPMRSAMVGWYCHTAAELWSRRVWLHKRRGMQGAFWLPSWNADVVVTATIEVDDDHIHIASVGFDELYAVPCDIVIETTGGGSIPFRVTSAADGGPGEEILSLETPYDGILSIPTTMIARVGKLTLSRLSSDRVEIQHTAGGGASISAPTIEAPAP